MQLRHVKDERVVDPIIASLFEDDEQGFGGIRCPHCEWRPSAADQWCCLCAGTPEPPFRACGTFWNTFSTGGRCPGCSHQWQWTSCLRCHQWALHHDWYESDRGQDS